MAVNDESGLTDYFLSDLETRCLRRKIAQGILHNVILQHELTGDNAGMWPDWRDLLKNRVLADIWYRNPRIGQLLLKWLDRETEPRTAVVKTEKGEIRVTTYGEVLNARYEEGRLNVRLKPDPGAKCHVAIAGVLPFDTAKVTLPQEATLGNISYHERYSLGFVRFDRNNAETVVLEAPVTVKSLR
jgi:hypothetical protein